MTTASACAAAVAAVALTCSGCGSGGTGAGPSPARVLPPAPSGGLNLCPTPVSQDLLFGCDADEALAEQICCHNTNGAEYAGYFQDVRGSGGEESGGLFAQLDATGTTTFYDSVCGKPLFRAPVGRSFDDWHAESAMHGWPSFRAEELVAENVEFRSDGEMRSVCGTHLGHNLPDGADRYCIDLVCIAGRVAAPGPLGA